MSSQINKQKIKRILTVTIAAVIAIGVILTVMLCGLFESRSAENVTEAQQTASDGFVITPDNSKKMSLSVAALASEDGDASNSYTVTATITPSDATNKYLSWSLAFENASSEWASGKSVTDYVSLSTSSLTATVTCLQPFGEAIILTAVSADNADITASCKLDYAARFDIESGIILQGSSSDIAVAYRSDHQDTMSGKIVYSDFDLPFLNGESYTLAAGGYTDGTLKEDISISVKASYYSDGNTNSSSLYSFMCSAYGSSYVISTVCGSYEWTSAAAFTLDKDALTTMFGSGAINGHYSDFYTALNQQRYNPNCGGAYIKFAITAEGAYSGTTEFYAYGYINTASMGVSVTGMDFDSSNLIF